MKSSFYIHFKIFWHHIFNQKSETWKLQSRMISKHTYSIKYDIKVFYIWQLFFKVLESSISRIKFCSTVQWWLKMTSMLIKTVAVISIHTAHFTVLVGKSSTLFLYSSQVYTDVFYLILIESYAKNYNILAHIQQSSHSHCYAPSFSTQWQKARNFHHQCTSTHRFEFLLLNRKM